MSMTENEAIDVLDELNCLHIDVIRANAIEIAIKALEEIQQYRAIGTIEEFKELKENNRFLEFLYDRILPNEMEQYLSMYKATDIKVNAET